ncbi:MAG TPA: KTSC domain-containing protein [Caulobacterales bacterium]|nr:KTSC domain-containing protein [Caulobacterales bacterium]
MKPPAARAYQQAMPAVKSSAIQYVRYDALTRELTVRLPAGVYVYEDVPAAIYDALMAAESKGAFYNLQIRDCFSFKR